LIIDFQHHFVPRELIKDAGENPTSHLDEHGIPRFTEHSLLYDLDEHIRMMDLAGIDAAVLSCAGPGMSADLETSRLVNNRTREAERNYPGRFIGIAHVHPLGGSDHLRELARCSLELGFRGVVIRSEFKNLYLDAPEFEPFWKEAARLGMYVFVHPASLLNSMQQFSAYDASRSVGREFSLIMATIHLINSGVLDRHPDLIIHMSHLGGGIASMLGRIRSYQDKQFWGTAASPRHGLKAEKEFDYYLRERMVFDTAGIIGEIRSVKIALLEIPAARIVFGTDYPQEIRSRDAVRDYVREIRSLGPAGGQILSSNAGLLLRDKTAASGSR
jgi:predicted TIM-barrel fold metal-dependent hydrolase